MQWMSILCETNTNPGIVLKLQRALDTAGFDPGSIDGVLGGATLRAVDAYQKSKGLASGHLTMETLKSLGVN